MNEHLHALLEIEPPTATYSLEALAAEVAPARRACVSIPSAADRLNVDAAVQQQAGAALEDAFGQRIVAPPTSSCPPPHAYNVAEFLWAAVAWRTTKA